MCDLLKPSNKSTKMETTFPFPFKPYDIQEKFMRELYLTLEEQKLGIFESPTGTVSYLLFHFN